MTDDISGFIRVKSKHVVAHALLNLRRIDRLPYAIDHTDKPYAGRTVYVVGAGPSIAINGEHLKTAQDNGAAVFAVNASACPTKGKQGILPSLGVVPDVVFMRESLDLSDQAEGVAAECVVLDVSAHPSTWSVIQRRHEAGELQGMWTLPLYPRHQRYGRRLSVRMLGCGSSALTMAVSHAIQWGASRIALVGVDLAFANDMPYHPEAPRGDERAEALGEDAVRFSQRDQDKERCERSGQAVGPDEIRVTHTIAKDFSGRLTTLHTWENQRLWLCTQAKRHGRRIDFINASAGGGGILGWRNAELRELAEDTCAEPIALPRGHEFHPSIREQLEAELRKEAGLYHSLARNQCDVGGPSIKGLSLMGVDRTPPPDNTVVDWRFLEGTLLVGALATADLQAEGYLDEGHPTPEEIADMYAVQMRVAEEAGELLT